MTEHWTDAHILSALNVEAFWANVERRGEDECWPWRGKTFAKDGYGRHYDAIYWKLGLHPGRARIDGSRNRYPVKRPRPLPAHRLAYVMTYGVPGGFADLCVCHSCDNPPCCNPRHFWLGTPGDNMRDRTRKGRTAKGDRNRARLYPETLSRGENHPHAKLTVAAVLDIRASRAAGVYQAVLAERYGVSVQTIFRVNHREAWGHIE